MSSHWKISHGAAFAVVLLLLGTISPALAAPPLAPGGGPAHSARSQRELLNLALPAIATSAIAQHRSLGFEKSGQALVGLHERLVRTGPIEGNEEGRSRVAFAIHWHADPPVVSPKVASLARNFRHNGLPIVHLWQSGRNLLAIGLNPHGKPGIYFTQQLPD